MHYTPKARTTARGIDRRVVCRAAAASLTPDALRSVPWLAGLVGAGRAGGLACPGNSRWRVVALVALAGIGLELVLNASLHDRWGGWAFGQRWMSEDCPVVARHSLAHRAQYPLVRSPAGPAGRHHGLWPGRAADLPLRYPRFAPPRGRQYHRQPGYSPRQNGPMFWRSLSIVIGRGCGIAPSCSRGSQRHNLCNVSRATCPQDTILGAIRMRMIGAGI